MYKVRPVSRQVDIELGEVFTIYKLHKDDAWHGFPVSEMITELTFIQVNTCSSSVMGMPLARLLVNDAQRKFEKEHPVTPYCRYFFMNGFSGKVTGRVSFSDDVQYYAKGDNDEE